MAILRRTLNRNFKVTGVLLLPLLLILLFNSRTLISTNGYVLFRRYGVNKILHISKTFQRILQVCIKTVFCNSVIFVSIPMFFNLFSRTLACVPRAPTTKWTTVTFVFHIFFTSFTTSKYFWIFSTSLSSTLVPYGIAKSIIWHLLAFFINENHFQPSCSYKMVYM